MSAADIQSKTPIIQRVNFALTRVNARPLICPHNIT
jgi:hypothetical protein